MKIFLFLFVFLNISALPVLGGNIDKSVSLGAKVKVTVWRNETTVVEFTPDRVAQLDDIFRVSLALDITTVKESANWARDFPVQLSLHAKGTVLSFTVPFGPKGEFSRADRTVCPKNHTVKIKETKKHKQKGEKTDEARKVLDTVDDFTIGPNGKPYAALATISSMSPKPINLTLHVWTVPVKSFLVDLNEAEPVKLTAKSSEPWYGRVDIPEHVSAVRISVNSHEGLCGILAVQPLACPLIASQMDTKLARYWQTFTSQGTLVVQRDELESFYVVILTLADDGACGNTKFEHGRADQKKSIDLRISTIGRVSEYMTPIILTLTFFAAFFLGTPIVRAVQTFQRAAVENGGSMSGRPVDELMDGSISRAVSPKPKSEVEMANLINIASSSATVVNDDVADSFLSGLDPLLHNQHTERSGVPTNNGVPNTLSVSANSAFQRSTPSEANDAPVYRDIVEQPLSSDVSIISVDAIPPKLRLDQSTRTYAQIHFFVCGFMTLSVFQQIGWLYPYVHDRDMDTCYFNYRCGIPFGKLNSFNHVFSNVGYVALGVLALVLLRRRYNKHTLHLKCSGAEKVHAHGVPAHYGMMAALGIGMIFQGLSSMAYHQCPNAGSIQFESTMIYLSSVVALLKLYGTRHEPTSAVTAYTTAFGLWLLATASSATEYRGWSWLVFVLLELIVVPVLSLQVYYHGHVAYSTQSMKAAYMCLKNVLWAELLRRNWKPLFAHRLVALIALNVVNFLTSFLVAVSSSTTMAQYLVMKMVINFILYFGYYLGNKIVAKEKIRKLTWFHIGSALFCWFLAFVFFFIGTTNWKATPAESRALNKSCVLLDFYDYHDIWHMLSASALFFSFMSMMTLDDLIKTKRRDEIRTF